MVRPVARKATQFQAGASGGSAHDPAVAVFAWRLSFNARSCQWPSTSWVSAVIDMTPCFGYSAAALVPCHVFL